MEPQLSVSQDINASPAAVYAALTDVTRMGEWSPENHANEWKDGATQAAVGARWVGHNRNGEFASWGFDIEATDNGCRVTEHWQDLRPEAAKAGVSEISGVGDRVPHNKTGMEATLAALAQAVEAS